MGYGRPFFCSCLLSGRAGVLLLLGSSGVLLAFFWCSSGVLLCYRTPEERQKNTRRTPEEHQKERQKNPEEPRRRRTPAPPYIRTVDHTQYTAKIHTLTSTEKFYIFALALKETRHETICSIQISSNSPALPNSAWVSFSWASKGREPLFSVAAALLSLLESPSSSSSISSAPLVFFSEIDSLEN